MGLIVIMLIEWVCGIHDNFIKYIEILVSVLVCKWPILVKCDTS
jgi:hypothetical protein